jgi:hypothetical protein
MQRFLQAIGIDAQLDYVGEVLAIGPEIVQAEVGQCKARMTQRNASFQAHVVKIPVVGLNHDSAPLVS